jgi:Tfp pilus assembly protein PilX
LIKGENMKNKAKNRKGIALLVALGTLIVIFIIGALGIYLVTRGLTVTGGQTRAENTLEACEAILEIGKSHAQKMNRDLTVGPITDQEINLISNYLCSLTVARVTDKAVTPPGEAQKFARAYRGIGASLGAAVGIRTYKLYHIYANAIGRNGEKTAIDIVQRYVETR